MGVGEEGERRTWEEGGLRSADFSFARHEMLRAIKRNNVPMRCLTIIHRTREKEVQQTLKPMQTGGGEGACALCTIKSVNVHNY